MLRIIVSPAKKMVAGSDSFEARNAPALSVAAAQLLDVLASTEPAELQKLWKVSDSLLEPCLDALDGLKRAGIPLHDDELAHPAFSGCVAPAAFAYSGIQYQSLAPQVMDEPALSWLQDHLRIISGFYGCVRPFDAVLPYRLEMGAKLAVASARDLYAFWGDAIAREVCRAGDGDAETISENFHSPTTSASSRASNISDNVANDNANTASGTNTHDVSGIVNLASVEYSKAVLPHAPADLPVYTCIFGEELKGGKPVQRSTASKTARGSMTRWMAEERIDDPARLKEFAIGYRFAPELSQTDKTRKTLVFMRA